MCTYLAYSVKKTAIEIWELGRKVVKDCFLFQCMLIIGFVNPQSTLHVTACRDLVFYSNLNVNIDKLK